MEFAGGDVEMEDDELHLLVDGDEPLPLANDYSALEMGSW